MNKLNGKLMIAMAAVVGVAGFAGSANAQDFRHDNERHGGPQHVVVVKETRVVHQVAPQHAKRGGLFDRLDINNNGAVSKNEFMQRYGSSRMAMQTFRRVDTNHSGQLGLTEVRAGRGMLKELRHV